MKFPSLADWVLPLTLVSFVAPALTFLPSGLFLSWRWPVLALAMVYMLFARQSLGFVQPSVIFAGAIYFIWCLVTASWSLVPELSLTKSAALGGVMFALILAGYDWARRHDLSESLNFMWGYAAVSLLVGILGPAGTPAAPDGSIVLYEGATGNPNMLGSMMATSTPLVVWLLYRDWHDKNRRMLWGALLASYSVILYLTTSRAAYLAFVGILTGFLLALGMRRYISLAVVAASITGILALMAPALTESIVNRNVYKYASEEQGVFFTREQGLEETYNAAVEGGWIGVGYGVSVNDTNFVVGVTAVGYGREKGNAQLAIIEETGIVGLILYVILMFTVFSELVGALRACRIKEHKVLMGVFIGTLVGMIANSMFEAWWVAPGSPEFVYFCAMSGTALGVAQAIRDKAALRVAPIWQVGDVRQELT